MVEMNGNSETSERTSQANEANDLMALKQQVQKLQVACAELNSLPPSRGVYVKQGAIFFRSNIKTLTNLQQNMLEKAKADLERGEEARP